MISEVCYNGKKYGVMTLFFKRRRVPVVIDFNMMTILKTVSDFWKCTTNGTVSGVFRHNACAYPVKLHEVIMSQCIPVNAHCPVIHINRMKLDNRLENLAYDTRDLHKNVRKKRRTITLPQDCGINPNDIPTYVWYSRADGKHGDRFVVKIGDVFWKSSCANRFTLQMKFEQTKAFLRDLFQRRHDLFEQYSMNGQYTQRGTELLNSFYGIINKAGFDHIKCTSFGNRTNGYLKEIKCKSDVKVCPKHMYYTKATHIRGDHFTIKYNGVVWISTTSKKISKDTKYQAALKKLQELIGELKPT